MSGGIVVRETKIKITGVKGARHTIYFRKDFVTDSAFPFQPGQELVAKIVGGKVIIEAQEKDAPVAKKIRTESHE